MKILFAASEIWPLLKTGGLGDIAYSLPHALTEKGQDVRIVLPAYREILHKMDSFKTLGWLSLSLAGKTREVRILEAHHELFKMPIWLVDDQELFDREGNPYSNAEGLDWPDNAERYALFSQAVAALGVDKLNLDWRADVVHSNDWQTGLVSAFLEEEADRPRRIFTIHNMAYGGYFPQEEFDRLLLPKQWWSTEGVEFYDMLSMLKAGIIYSDAVTTVSPTYAEEICTPEFGYGLDGVLLSRSYKLTGILNGIDTEVWNPQKDTLIPHKFTPKKPNPGKQKNKQALFESYDIEVDDDLLNAPLLGMVSRLVEQKGIDMVLDAIPVFLAETDANFVIIGTGHSFFETRLKKLNAKYPRRIFITIGYDETKAHLLEAGSDIFLMPSRFEPCGLNQMYSLNYGTLPIVNRTGGLADTVINADFTDSSATPDNKNANGFVIDTPNTKNLIDAIHRALSIYANKKQWLQLQHNAMSSDFSWDKSADAYMELYMA